MSDKILKQISTEKIGEISLLALIQKIWTGRMFIIRACCIGLVIGLVLGYSFPKEYTTSVTMAPEVNVKSGTGNFGALASIAGINLSNNSGDEALSPELYPDIVRSNPFLLELFPVQVTTQNGDMKVSLYEYLDKHQHSPWWNIIIKLPSNIIYWTKSLFSSTPKISSDSKFNSFQLTSNQLDVLKNLSNSITVNVDKKSGVISLSVTMQDPLISASLTDTVMRNLQTYITVYRTNKAKHDLAYTEKLYIEARDDYYLAQQKYASFADSNRDIILTGYRSRSERLQNEVTLAYGLYNQISQQLQIAKAKVQEVTPIYTVIQPASMPLSPSKPNKAMILFFFSFIAIVLSIGWILLGKDLFDNK